MSLYWLVLLVYIAYLAAGLLAVRSACEFSVRDWATVGWNRTVVVGLLLASLVLWVIPLPIPFYWCWLHPWLRRARTRRLVEQAG